MSFSVSIMAHPARVESVGRLRHALGEDVPVSWDLEGPPARDHERLWRVARTAWSLRAPHADWHLLLQDDAIPVPGLLSILPALFDRLDREAKPGIMSLYLGRTRPIPGVWHTLAGRADAAGATWIVGPMIMWGVAIAVPSRLIPDMIAWGDTQRGIPDDMRVGRWGKARRLDAWHPWPSLVDHPDGESMIGHGPGRTARRFAGDTAADVDWSGGRVVRYGG